VSSKLNVGALRRFFLPLDKDSQSSYELRQLSRRNFIRLSGASAVAGPSILASLGALEVVGDENRISFKLGGIERWVIDPERFSGSPQLKVRRTTRSIGLWLTGARYPGTQLIADLECEVVKHALDWHMVLRLGLGEFKYSTSFERWLLGTNLAACRAHLSPSRMRVGSEARLEIGGPTVVEFFPDWTLNFKGPEVVRMSGPKMDVSADCGSLALPLPSEPSLQNPASFRRTMMVIRRGLREWRIDHDFDPKNEWKLSTPRNVFDSLQIELGEEKDGSRSQALVAESQSPANAAQFYPGEKLVGDDGKPVEISLERVQYAMSFAPESAQTAFLARIAESQQWAHSNGLSFGLTNPDQGPTLEVLRENDGSPRIQFGPRLLRLAAPFTGALMHVSAVADGTRMAFSWGSNRRSVSGGANSFLDIDSKSTCISMEGYRVSVLRPDDFLSLSFEFSNLCLIHHSGKSTLRPIDSAKPGILIACFPPQSIAEQAFFEGTKSYPVSIPKYAEKKFPAGESVPDKNRTNSEPLSEPPVDSRLSGESRLAFEVSEEIPFTLQGLLDWKSLKPSLSPLAQPAGGKPGPTEAQLPEKLPPLATYTAIEFPYRLYLSPNSFSIWDHPDQRAKNKEELARHASGQETPSRRANKDSGSKDDSNLNREGHDAKRVELWHARLSSKAPNQQNVRAIWSWDYSQDVLKPPPQDTKPFRMSTSCRDRHEIVHLSADYTLKNGGAGPGPCDPFKTDYEPLPIEVTQLMLSSLGAWINSRGAWPIPKGNKLTVEEWRHMATLGRDHNVRVVYKGYLFPFGHRASLVKVTERKFQRCSGSVNGKVVAYLRQRMYIVVREPLKSFVHLECQPAQGRKLPFKTVRITSLVTPNLDDPKKTEINHLGQDAFWPYVAGVPFRFQLEAEDRCSPANYCKFTLPLVFVGVDVTDICAHPTLDDLQGVFAEYEDPTKHDLRRVAEFEGQPICYADSNKPGDTQLTTNRVVFGAEPHDPCSDMAKCFLVDDQPAFFPTIDCAEVSVSSVQQLTGSRAPTWIYFHDSYVKSGFSVPENKGEVFAAFVNPISVQFGSQDPTATVTAKSDKSGGLATPNMAILGLSRRFGPVSGPPTSAPARPGCWLAPPQAALLRDRSRVATSDPLANFVNGTFNPLQYFEDQINARILGVISLADIIPELKDFTNQIEKVPQLINQVRQEVLKDIAPIQDAINAFLESLKGPAVAVNTALAGIQDGIKKARQQAQSVVLAGMKKLDGDVNTALSNIPSIPPPGLLDARKFVQSSILDKLQAIDSTLTLAIEDETELEGRIKALTDDILTELRNFADDTQSVVVKVFDAVDTSLNTSQLIILITSLQNDVKALDLQKLHDDLLSAPLNLRDLLESALRLKTLFPDGSTALLKITQMARNHLQHLKDKTGSALIGLRDQIDSDLQQVHDHAAQQVQVAINALRTQVQKTFTDLESVVLNEIQQAIDNIIDKALDQLWPLVEQALEAVQIIKDTLGKVEELRQTLMGLTNLLSVPIEASANLYWKPELHNYPSSGTPVFEVDDGLDSLEIDVTITTRLRINAGQASVGYKVNGTLKNFSVCLLPAVQPFIKIHFDSLLFSAHDGSKLNIQANISKPPTGVQFLGVLEFVKDLEDDLQGLTKGTGPFLEVSEDGVLAGLRLAIPTVTVGAMSLQNISISAAVNLPFTGQPVRFRFSFAERQHPCILTVGVFGGGFFVGLSIGLDGIELFEGAFEFGGNFAFDAPAVSGAAYAMAGLYFRAEGQQTLITGYFRSGGVLDIFDIISIYIDIYLGLSYETSGSGTVVSGDAIVTVSVEIGFFSISTGFSYHKEFQGSSSSSKPAQTARRLKAVTNTKGSSLPAGAKPPVGPQGVADLMDKNEWEQYCGVFATN